MTNSYEPSILMPCLNESEPVGGCIKKAAKFLNENQVTGEIIVADNGSIDGSQEIIQNHSAKLVFEPELGYGKALMAGIQSSEGKFIIMGDSDDSYNFEDLMPFLIEIRGGYDLVIGNRFHGGIKKNAMPFTHKYIGNPFLSFLGRTFYNCKIGDFYCGLRGFSKKSYLELNLKSHGMQFAYEMVINAAKKKMKITEVPNVLYPDSRNRIPHLKTFSDGFKTLKLILMDKMSD